MHKFVDFVTPCGQKVKMVPLRFQMKTHPYNIYTIIIIIIVIIIIIIIVIIINYYCYYYCCYYYCYIEH